MSGESDWRWDPRYENEFRDFDIHQKLRIKSLELAARLMPNTPLPNVFMYADLISEWILDGEVPKLPAGVTW